jgi:RNase P subunit RPR2
LVVVAIAVPPLLARGKRLKCPNCGTVFAVPIMDEKRHGFGLNFAYTSKITCPNCGQRRSRGHYQKEPKAPQNLT